MSGLESIDFDERNIIVSGEGYFNLYVHKSDKSFISCWHVPFWKRVKLLFTGKIWLLLQHCNQPQILVDYFDEKNYHQPTSITIDKPFMVCIKNK